MTPSLNQQSIPIEQVDRIDALLIPILFDFCDEMEITPYWYSYNQLFHTLECWFPRIVVEYRASPRGMVWCTEFESFVGCQTS